MLRKIISGGQTGADQGGLRAGRVLGLETGGTAPWNWMTEDGPQQELLESFGLVAGPYDTKVYPKRTRLNVKNSDATVIFGNILSPGSRLTIKLCMGDKKPCIKNPTARELRVWLDVNKVRILNVAGNREGKNPGIGQITMDTIQHSM